MAKYRHVSWLKRLALRAQQNKSERPKRKFHPRLRLEIPSRIRHELPVGAVLGKHNRGKNRTWRHATEPWSGKHLRPACLRIVSSAATA
jgi:hypothetical protein